jgi:carbamoyltransferase
MYILGINAYHGNASAAVIADGRLIAAVEEERFSRVKYAAGFPSAAIRYCLDAAGITLSEVDHIAIPRNPWARVGTKLWYALKMPSFARERAKVMVRFTGIPEALAQAFDLAPEKIRAKYHRIEHHQAHLASTFFVSPFDQAALLSADGLGDFASTMWGTAAGIACTSTGRLRFRTRSDCITRPCLNTSAFANSATNTRSWASPRMASPLTWTSSAISSARTAASASGWVWNISNIIAPDRK